MLPLEEEVAAKQQQQRALPRRAQPLVEAGAASNIFYLYAAKLKLNEWRPNERASSDPIHSIPIFLESIAKQNFSKFIKDLGTNLSSFDWRTSATPGLEEDVRRSKLVFRGSGGYKELRTQLLEHLAGFDSEIGKTAKRLIGKS